MTSIELVKRAWEESNYSEDLFEITSRLEDYAMEFMGTKIKSDRVYWLLDNFGLQTTNKVMNVLKTVKQNNMN
jgi:hypothetical protein